MVVKKVLLIDYGKDDSLYKYLDSLDCYNLTRARNYNDFKNNFENKIYDLCFIDIDDINEYKFILHFIIHSKENQRVLQIYKDDISCLFEKQCNICEKYNVKTIKYTSKEKVHKYLYNYDSSKCEFIHLT